VLVDVQLGRSFAKFGSVPSPTGKSAVFLLLNLNRTEKLWKLGDEQYGRFVVTFGNPRLIAADGTSIELPQV